MPSVSGILLVWLAAGVLTLVRRARLRGAGVGVSADGRRVRVPEGSVLARARLPLGLGDVLEHALRHHRRHRDGVRAVRRRTSSRWATSGLRLVAVAVIVVLSAVNYVGVRHGGLVQNVFTAAKVAGHRRDHRRRARVARSGAARPRTAPARRGRSRACAASSWPSPPASSRTAAGTWSPTPPARRRMPARTIPRALLIGTLIVTACYAGLNAIYLRVLPLDAVRGVDARRGRRGRRAARRRRRVDHGGARDVLDVRRGERDHPGRAARVLLDGARRPAVPLARRRPSAFGTPHRAIVLQAIWSSVARARPTPTARCSRA